MKKAIITIIVTLFLASIMAFNVGSVQAVTIDIAPDTLNLYSQGEWITAYIEPSVLFKDDFDSEFTGADPSKWTVTEPTGTNVLIDDIIYYGTTGKSCKLADDSTTVRPNMLATFTPQTGKFVYEAAVRQGQTDRIGTHLYVSEGDGDLDVTRIAVAVVFWGDGNIKYNDGGTWNIAQTYSADTWYKAKVIVDIPDQKYDLYIDGDLKASDVAFRYTHYTLDTIYQTTHTLTSMMWVDDVLVTDIDVTTIDLTTVKLWHMMFSDYFEGYTLPSDGSPTWDPVNGTWIVESDTQWDGTTGQVYSQNNIEGTAPPHWSLAGDYSWTDYVVEVKAKGIEGHYPSYGTDTWVGLVFRAEDTTHFYEYYFRTAVDDIIVVKNDGGTRTVVSGPVSFTCANGVWYTLKVIATGNSFSFFADGVEITGLAFTDTTSPFRNGKVGVYVWDGTHAHFDDVIVLSHITNAELEPKFIGDYDNDLIPDLMVKFDRAVVANYLYNLGITSGEVELAITGQASGAEFAGSDSVRVIAKGKCRL